MLSDENRKIIKSLPIWKGNISINNLEGGKTNHNFLVIDGSEKLVVRIGEDIIEHHIIRSNELIASKAAYDAGIGPEVVFNSKGVLVLKYIESKPLTSKDVSKNINNIISLIKKTHYELPKKIYGPGIVFWVFHVIRNYAIFLKKNKSSHIYILEKLLNCSDELEKLSAPYQIVFGHNDLLASNFLDDGSRLWLIDWEYSGFNSPLFDLGGLASNNDFLYEEEIYLLENYFDKKIDNLLLKQYSAMKCASLLRETMWSMVSEITSKIDFDYSIYTKENLKKFEDAYKKLI